MLGFRDFVAYFAALTIVALSSVAGAQPRFGVAEVSGAVFHPSAASQRYVEVDGALIGGFESPPIGVLFDYAYRPLYVKTFCEDVREISCVQNGSKVAFLEHAAILHLTGAYAIGDRVEIGLGIPLVYAEGESLVYSAGTSVDDIRGGSGTGLGDPRLQINTRFLGDRATGWAVGLVAWATAPLGQATMEGRFVGDDGPNVGAHAVGEMYFGETLRAAVNLGGFYRPSREIIGAEVGPMMSYGAALDWSATPIAGVAAEVSGATAFGFLADDAPVDRLEGRALGRLRLGPVEVEAGGGVGLVLGPGAPTFRVLAGARWADVPEKDEDGDGVRGEADSCPDIPEDMDGFADEDGCPETDNDSDGIDDADDACPDQAEDEDGNEDEDGCPDADDDGDGIEDGWDSCPNTPEDMDGDRDTDGCPDQDTDRDGIDDELDQCPEEPEDADGLVDEDGCPEEDADGDGIADEEDACPATPGEECPAAEGDDEE